MILYLLSRDDLAIKAVRTLSSYEFKEDIDFDDSSAIVIANYVQMEDGDFALIKNGSEQTFFGICKEMKPSDNGYKITLKQKEKLFDTTVFNDGEELIQSTGIEDYIVKVINDNFISSRDSLMDMGYIEVSASTHTPLAAKVSTIVDADNGVFNFKTFLGNVRQNYGIFLDFTVENGLIRIDVNCREQTVLNVDTKLPEVTDVSETYGVQVLAKLIVKWDTPKEYATVERVESEIAETRETVWILDDGGIAIPESADLDADEYKIPGNYYCRSNAAAATLVNCPTKNAFTMKVSSGTGEGHYPKQEISDYAGGKNYKRTYRDLNAEPSWENWIWSYSGEEIDAKLLGIQTDLDGVILRVPELCSNNAMDNIDNPRYNGVRHCATATTGTKPTTYGEVLNILESLTYSQHQMYFTSNGLIYHRNRNNNGTDNSVSWSNWRKLGFPQAGIATVTATKGTYTDVAVTFGWAFASTPIVTVSFNVNSTNTQYATDMHIVVLNRSTTGCTIRVFNGGSTTLTTYVAWIAMAQG